ncbi:hypothetical protein BH18THE2_BH18THE2_34000 [soil metagenome]
MILKSKLTEKITNLTTAAAVWFAAAIGIAISFNFYFIAQVAIYLLYWFLESHIFPS